MNKKVILTGIIALVAATIVIISIRSCDNSNPKSVREIANDAADLDDSITRSELTETTVDEEDSTSSDEGDKDIQSDLGVISYWYGEWISDDDWKRHTDYLTMEKDKGGYILTESIDPNNPRVYVFDKKRGFFIYERDFYGKTLIDEIRFKDKNHLVLTKRSGKKSFDDTYRRNR